MSRYYSIQTIINEKQYRISGMQKSIGWLSERPHLSMSWCDTLPPVDSNQCILLYRDVKLQEAWLLQPELRTPEHPRWNVLTHPLPDIHLSNIK